MSSNVCGVDCVVRVLGVTSICEGSPHERANTQHLFMLDFDETPFEWVWEEAKRLHDKFGIDIYIFKSSEDGYHMLSFDVLPWRLVQTIQADCRLETDYPLINTRYVDKFLTLRISEKGKKPYPQFVARLVAPNKYEKSRQHYDLYMRLAGLVEAPCWYAWKDVKLFLASYLTKHRINVR